MSEASDHQGLWTDPQYPGDAVRLLSLKRGDEIGSIRIQHYGDFVKVGSFLPGVVDPEDSSKVWPEKSTFYVFGDPADGKFDEYVQEAYAALWQNDYSKER